MQKGTALAFQPETSVISVHFRNMKTIGRAFEENARAP